MLTEILGDSIRQDLNFVAKKMETLRKEATVIFIGKNYDMIKTLKQALELSKIEIDPEDEARFLIKNEKYPNLKIIFTTIKDASKIKADFSFLIDPGDEFKDFEKFSSGKTFLLTSREHETDFIKEVRDKYYKRLEIIQLGLPESWIEF